VAGLPRRANRLGDMPARKAVKEKVVPLGTEKLCVEPHHRAAPLEPPLSQENGDRPRVGRYPRGSRARISVFKYHCQQDPNRHTLSPCSSGSAFSSM